MEKTEFQSSEQIRSGIRPGPRVKNVCRRASVALGSRAKFLPPTAVPQPAQDHQAGLTLSALPDADKERVLLESKSAGKMLLKLQSTEISLKFIILHCT